MPLIDSKTAVQAYSFKPNRLTEDIRSGILGMSLLMELETSWVYDPQHYGRQKSLDQIKLLQSINPDATNLFAIRGYWRWDTHDRWSPYGDPVIGPQWPVEWHENEHDEPDLDFERYDYFRGHMDAAGWKVPDRCLPHKAQKLFPYLFHYSTDKSWKMLTPYQYRPYAWVMQWHDRNWRNRLADYHVRYAQWVEPQFPGHNLGFVVSTSKPQHYWTMKERHSRTPRMPSPPAAAGSQGKANDLLYCMQAHDWKFNIADNLDGSHVAYPLTNQAQWLYGVCSLPGKIRYRLDRAGLPGWIVAWQMDRVWHGSTYNSLVQVLGGEEKAHECIFVNSLKAASNCDFVYWPKSFQAPPPWVEQLKIQMAKRTVLLNRVDWP